MCPLGSGSVWQDQRSQRSYVKEQSVKQENINGQHVKLGQGGCLTLRRSWVQFPAGMARVLSECWHVSAFVPPEASVFHTRQKDVYIKQIRNGKLPLGVSALQQTGDLSRVFVCLQLLEYSPMSPRCCKMVAQCELQTCCYMVKINCKCNLLHKQESNVIAN